MSIFNLFSIDYGLDNRTGGPNDLILNQRGKYKISKYPLDVGNYDKGHYMIFHINQQRESQFKDKIGPELPIIKQNQRATGLTASNLNVSLNRDATGILDSLNFGGSSFGNVIGQFERPIERTVETIALYMPDTVQYQQNQRYSTPSTTNMLSALLSAGKSSVDAYKKSSSGDGSLGQNLMGNLGVFAGAGLLGYLKGRGLDSGFTQAFGQSVLGAVQNPLLEVIYSSPDLRAFRFDFMLYPRDEREASEVQRIIKMFRYYQSPEILEKSAGFFLVPPSEFDIQFYYNGRINPNIPPISTCVLEAVDVDYAPNGWAAYETGGSVNSLNPTLGGTGMPVAIRLSLQFRETEIVTKQLINATEGRPSSVDLSIYGSMTGNLDGGNDSPRDYGNGNNGSDWWA